MKRYIAPLICAALATGAIAENRQTEAHNPIVKDSRVHAVPMPARGHSSFTESQAKGRIAKAGYTNIGDLTKTGAGAWRGRAAKGRHKVMVTLDYKGNVTAS